MKRADCSGIADLALIGEPPSPRVASHSNNFGVLRLVFASMVILAHTPEAYDGNRDREILTRVFGSISFGELGVDAFFLISGYLITASFMNSRTPANYLMKRVARIYPGFLCAYLFCVLVALAIGGARAPQGLEDFASIVVRALLLQEPNVGTVFEGTPYPYLNVSMWTISHEFKCYLIVLLLGVLGLLRRPQVILALTIALMALTVALPVSYHPFEAAIAYQPIPGLSSLSDWSAMLVGAKREAIRLVGVFLAGSCFHLYRDRVKFTVPAVVLSIVAAGALLTIDRLAHLGVAVLGGYLILAAAQASPGGPLSRMNNENDVSYGVYLYAFPVTKIYLWWFPHAPLPSAIIVTFLASYLLGWLSWLAVERPVMQWARGSRPVDRRARRLDPA
jgi:peptidoglycan/LPS O-acetylase OafA/YrhL